MNSFPLIYNFSRIIEGNKFLAIINVKCHILMKKDYQEWWIYGVTPGNIAANGETQEEVRLKFQESLEEVIIDIIKDCKDFDEFNKEVTSILNKTNQPNKLEWEEMREKIKNKKTITNAFINNLKKEKENVKPSINVHPLLPEKSKVQTPDSKKNCISLPCTQAA